MDLPQDISLRLIRLDDKELPPWQDLLTREECRRLTGFRSDRRKRMFVQGRVAARLLLAEYLAMMPLEVPLENGDDGAPIVPGFDVFVSIAHAGGYGFAAASTSPIGIDIERVKPRNSELYRYVLHPDEYPLFEQMPLDRNEAQILLWALKESTLKAMGTGFRLSPKKLMLTHISDGSAFIKLGGEKQWRICYKKHNGYYLTVAFEE